MTITLTRKEAQQVLDALEYAAEHIGCAYDDDAVGVARKALRARLLQCERCGEVNPAEIHTCTPKREWQGLTDEERTYLAWESNNGPHCVAMTEAMLKQKNA
jgi:deoxyinosine 3'endonuclease (endonuclease V)